MLYKYYMVTYDVEHAQCHKSHLRSYSLKSFLGLIVLITQ